MKMAYPIFQVEYAESCARARQVAVELQSRRKEFVSQAFSTIFPIEVEPLSPQDAGEEGETRPIFRQYKNRPGDEANSARSVNRSTHWDSVARTLHELECIHDAPPVIDLL